jgi:N-methylhydantoinase B
MQVFYSMEGVVNRSLGVRGGGASLPPGAYCLEDDGQIVEHPETVGAITLRPGQRVGSRSAGGGGYGNPLDREPELVLADVREGYVTLARAQETYGVVLRGDPRRFEMLSVDEKATAARRAGMAEFGSSS